MNNRLSFPTGFPYRLNITGKIQVPRKAGINGKNLYL